MPVHSGSLKRIDYPKQLSDPPSFFLMSLMLLKELIFLFAKYISVIESDSDYICWFKLDKSCLNIDEDMHFGAVYTPPFNTQDEMEMSEVEISSLCISHKFYCLVI